MFLLFWCAVIHQKPGAPNMKNSIELVVCEKRLILLYFFVAGIF